MKTIKENGLNELVGYAELKNEEKFIYEISPVEFVAIKVNEEYAVFLNGKNKFIIAKKFKNCLSIGATSSMEYDTYAEAVERINKGGTIVK